jgi:hypothetical protein
MTQDEARQLLGGYATGALSEAERNALFQAALEDQELFEELAGEQALKEVLDEPGARQRLIAALGPSTQPARSWVMRTWPWAAAATLAAAIVIGIVVSTRTEPPQQIAQVLKSAEPAPAPPVAAPAPPPAPVRRKVAPPAEAPQEKLADQARPQAFGAVGGAPAAAARAENMAAKVPGGFAFNYAVGADRSLEIVPAARGFLSVSANDAVIFPSGVVSAGTPVGIPIPADATSLVIAFSGMPGIIGSPVRRDEKSGTVTDQNPPNERILIQLSLTPATR